MAEYTFDKHMMAGERIDIAKAYNDGNELLSPFAVLIDDEFFTKNGLYESGLINEWQIRVLTSSPKKVAASTPTEFKCPWSVAYDGQGLKTWELTVDDFEAITEEGELMTEFYSFIPANTALNLINAADGFEGLWHINSKGDYVSDGETFTFAEDTESFTITWQDDIPGDKGEIVTGFVVRTTPHTEPDR